MEKKINQNKRPIIAITHGDINGISYEIMLKAFKDSRVYSKFTPVIYGSPKVAAYYKKVMKMTSLSLNHVQNIDEIAPNMINIINCVTNKVRVEIGKSTEMAGISSLNAIRHALVDYKNGKIDALVTAPINKHNIQSIDFQFKGHTDFLKNEFKLDDVLMLMVHENIRITLVTEHLKISDVANSITEEKILSKLRLLKSSLRRDFNITNPKIAVLGLNPHSGDSGLIGNEDVEIIVPALKKANEEGILAMGPYAADGFFGFASYNEFDAVLAMYHDQGLAPFKILARGAGVNYTAGLPFVRTSPAHGTAYNIAGKNKSNPKSFIDSLYAAYDIYLARTEFDKIKPLKTNLEENK